jgi:hypothetical protein
MLELADYETNWHEPVPLSSADERRGGSAPRPRLRNELDMAVAKNNGRTFELISLILHYLSSILYRLAGMPVNRRDC